MTAITMTAPSVATFTRVDPAAELARLQAVIDEQQILEPTSPVTCAPKCRSILMETDAFYRWLEELVGVNPDTGELYPADFIMNEEDNSDFVTLMGYRDTDYGTVVAFVSRHLNQVEVLLNFEPTTSLRHIVDLMLEQSKLKAA